MKQHIIKILVLCLLLIFVAGCGSDKEDKGEIQVHDLQDEELEGQEAENTEITDNEVESKDDEEQDSVPLVIEDETEFEDTTLSTELMMDDDEQETLEGRLNRNTKATVSRTFTPQLTVGESMVLGFGITNTRSLPYNFDVKPTFVRATYGSGTGIQFVEEETVLGWLEGFGDSYFIDDQEQLMFPFKVTVGDTINSDGDPVEEGNYVFEFVVTYQEGNFNTDHEIVEFTVKTKTE